MSNSNIKSQNKKIYSAYDDHLQCTINFDPLDDKTKQSFGDECNINIIMHRYEKTGIIESGNIHPPQYGECSAFDFQTSQNIIIQAQNMFNALPAAIRSKFDNDPHTMLGWCDDPQNHQEAVKLGLFPASEAVSEGSTSLIAEVAPTPRKSPTKEPEAPSSNSQGNTLVK